MTNEPDKTKRWQFGLRGIVAYMTMLSIPLVAWTWAMRVQHYGVWLTAVIAGLITAGGAIGATIGWLATGKTKGLAVGYLVGAIVGFIAYFALTYLLASLILANALPPTPIETLQTIRAVVFEIKT